MAFVPYAAGYGYPGQYGYPGAFGAYGPSLEEVKKIRDAEETAFKAAEAKRMELIEAEKKQYEEYVEAQKKAVEDAVTKEKEFYEKERELVKKLGGYPYAFGGAHGYGYPGYAGVAPGYAAGYGGYYGGARAGYGYPYRF